MPVLSLTSRPTGPVATVASALRRARRVGVASLDAQVLLAHRLRKSREWLIAHDESELERAHAEAFHADVARRARGEPLAYLVGLKEFRGLLLNVDPHVLIPRPETEHLVDWGVELLDRWQRRGVSTPRVVDLGTGSGAIALAIKAACGAAHVEAVDVSPGALEVARGNAATLGLSVEFGLGDWWDGLPGRAFHLALCNPPYVASSDPHLATLGHEPRSALTPGPRGLEALERVIAAAAKHLVAAGWLLVEHGSDQAGAVRRMMGDRGLSTVETRSDLAGLPRCTGGCLSE
jgi:release factor glutamine methyltransferase